MWNEQAYLDANPDVAAAVKNGVFATGWDHYQANGEAEGRDLAPSSYGTVTYASFSSDAYMGANPDVAAAVKSGAVLSAWAHFTAYGYAEGRTLTPADYGTFNEETYLAANADVAAVVQSGAMASGWQHYSLYGKAEGRSLAPSTYGDFSEDAYLAANPDVASAVKTGALIDGWQHYTKYGAAEGRLLAPDGYQNFGGTVVGTSLTNATDTLSANVFNAGLVYNPAGTDRINSLQSEDTLTGTGTNPTLNATLGNANDNGVKTITPTLKNIETVNLDITGDTNTLDVRFADSLETIAINKLTAEAKSAVTVDNIGQPAADLTVKNSALVGNTVNFNYINGVLAGTTAAGTAETGKLTVSNVNMTTLHVGNAANSEGFETVNLNVSNTNQISTLRAVDLENLNITGSGNLSILNTTQNTDRVLFTAGGLAIGDGLGIRAIDLSGFTGTDSIDISNALGGHADPANSGQKYFTTITGSAGSDTFWTGSDLAVDSATLKDVINGGDGSDTLKLVDSSVKRVGEVVGKTDTTKAIASVTNVENLAVTLQSSGAETVNLAAFDSALSTVTLRNEQVTGAAAAVAGAFTLREVGSAIATSGITLQHASGAGATGQGTPTGVVDTVNVRLADASGTADTVALTVKTDLNTSSTYDYAIGLEAEKNASDKYTGWVENLTLTDSDNENNTVTAITGNDSKGNITALGLTGTITLKGGTADKTYTVNQALYAQTVDASAQASNLSLKVANPTDNNNYGTTVQAQTVKLGTGSDTLTMDGLDTLNGNDTITDAGGTDTLRAVFSKDMTGTLAMSAVEKFQIAATNNAAIDMSKVSGMTELALLSDYAVDANNEIFTTGIAAGQIAQTDTITLSNTTLNTINFFADMDGTGLDGADVNTLPDSKNYTQTFNGLTLSNNTGADLTIAISAPLANVGAGEIVAPNNKGDGIKAYNIGKLTTHGVTNMNITVSNEYSADGLTVKAADALTTITNIYDKDLVTFTATALGSMDLGTVSGNATGNNIKTFDVDAVGGNFKAEVLALGDNAVVTLAAGDNIFKALGSAGKGVSITSYNGTDEITGTAQSDTIVSGAGNDTVLGDRGDNVISAGAGNDIIEAKDGNNTVSFGTGVFETATINLNTNLDATKATNVFTLDGSAAQVKIDIDGKGIVPGDVDQMLAVGTGSSLRMEWTGGTLNESNALLDGGKAVTTAAAGYIGDANANFVIAGAGESTTFNGGAGNDVLIKLDAAAVTFSGGAGNDAFVGNKTVANLVTGGAGADVIVLASDNTVVGAAVAAKVTIADGDSTAAAYDQVYGFNTATAANSLDLVFTNIQANTASADGTNVGTGDYAVKTHAIASGVVTFDNADLVFGAAEAVGTGATQIKLADALSYLATNLNGTSATVGFAYDANGDGDTVDASDSFFIFQDGATDTVVQLVGVAAANGGVNVAAVAAAAGANTVLIS